MPDSLPTYSLLNCHIELGRNLGELSLSPLVGAFEGNTLVVHAKGTVQEATFTTSGFEVELDKGQSLKFAANAWSLTGDGEQQWSPSGLGTIQSPSIQRTEPRQTVAGTIRIEVSGPFKADGSEGTVTRDIPINIVFDDDAGDPP